MSTRPRRIHLLGQGARFEENYAAAVITPGMLVSTDINGKVVPHATAGGVAERLYALEDALQGRTIDDNYAIGELVFQIVPMPGDVIFGILNAGEHATADEYLTSAGNGKLKVAGGSDTRVAKALEEIDLSDTAEAGESNRIRVRIL